MLQVEGSLDSWCLVVRQLYSGALPGPQPSTTTNQRVQDVKHMLPLLHK